jgi:nicotinate-nucleotide adenylyltransferase
METSRLREIIARVESASGQPHIEFVKRAGATTRCLTTNRLGVFASSFNPTTVAHVELMRLASEHFSLDETLALAGRANADKTDYDCSLEDRLQMLALAFEGDERVSIGLCSHAFFVDTVEALASAYGRETDLHFVVGFDTFERVIDCEDKYTQRYHRKFNARVEALGYLFERSRLVVAGRAGAGYGEVRGMVERELGDFAERVLYLETPAQIGEMSASEVRSRVRAGLSIDGLVPSAVAAYINERGLYVAS